MQCLFFVMKVNQTLSDLLHDFPAMFWVEFSNKVWQVSIGTVLQDDDQELLFLVEKEFSGFKNVGMIKRDVHLGFSFCLWFVFFGDRNYFEGILTFVDGFSEVDLAKWAFSKKMQQSVVLNFLEHELVKWVNLKNAIIFIEEINAYWINSEDNSKLLASYFLKEWIPWRLLTCWLFQFFNEFRTSLALNLSFGSLTSIFLTRFLKSSALISCNKFSEGKPAWTLGGRTPLII